MSILPGAADLAALTELSQKYPFLFKGVDPREQKTCAEIVDLYLKEAAEDLGPEALGNRQHDLLLFVGDFGPRPTRPSTFS